MNFGKVLPTAVPLIVVCVEIVSDVVMCSKPKQNQWILHAFDVLGVLVRVFVSSTTLWWIDDLLRVAAGGRIRNSKTNMEIEKK